MAKKEKKLEEEVKYSKREVLKRTARNIKDDLDPIYKGAKAGFFALHGIPTWKRHSDEHKMECNSKGWMWTSGLFTFGATVGAYSVATLMAIPFTGPFAFSILGLPLASQGGSYLYEAYNKAQKSVLEEIVMTKVNDVVNTKESSAGYDLTCEEILDVMADKIYEDQNPGLDPDDDTHKDRIEAMKKKSRQMAKNALKTTSKNLFKDLYADKRIGKSYKLSKNLLAGPRKRLEDKDYRNIRHLTGNESHYLTEIIENTVKKKGGSANIELLGTVKSVYSAKNEGEMHYAVTPNELWKK